MIFNKVLSIITVNYNNNEGLIRTIESIKRQEFDSYEHIIIDADSADESLETIQQYAKENPLLSFWVSEPDKGIYDGMNKGIAQARGEYFLFLNSGDILEDNVLRKIPFDGTRYIYGDAVVRTSQKEETWKYPKVPDLIYLSNNSLPHQSSFIHRSLFEQHLYDINYKIVADWAHSVQCILLENCSYKHLNFIISICDGTGISSNLKELRTERTKWVEENLPPHLSKAFIECSELERSAFRSIIPLLNKSRKFQKRAQRLVLFLYRINKLFSR